MAEITQTISTVTSLPTPPNPNNTATFDDLAYPYTVAQNAFGLDVNDMATELNTFATQTNAVKDEVNTAKNTAVSSANTAITKASEASVSATSAYNAQLAAEAALDNFYDRYLGAKATTPTLDNDGNPLQSGAMYWNTTNNTMYVRDATLNQWISLAFVPTYHGGLTGLGDDDHTQYHNDARGDARYLKLSGGTMTGAVTALKETSVAMPANDINLANGNLFTKTISGATTLTVSNAPTSGTVGYFILQLTNGGSAMVTWFSGVKWPGGTAPTLTAAGKDILSFYTHDGGTTWNVIGINKDVK